MTELNKDCTLCLYDKVCMGRKHKADIKDCCIPEAPLRELQRKAFDISVDAWMSATHKYINTYKKASKYWQKTLDY